MDKVSHHFYECVECINFWKNLEEWLNKKVKVKFHFALCEIIFGLPLSGDPLLEVLIFVIILAKQFINNKRSCSKELLLIEVKYTLKEKLKVMIKTGQNATETLNQNDTKLHFIKC